MKTYVVLCTTDGPSREDGNVYCCDVILATGTDDDKRFAKAMSNIGTLDGSVLLVNSGEEDDDSIPTDAVRKALTLAGYTVERPTTYIAAKECY